MGIHVKCLLCFLIRAQDCVHFSQIPKHVRQRKRPPRFSSETRGGDIANTLTWFKTILDWNRASKEIEK